jgi:hypothetical protein
VSQAVSSAKVPADTEARRRLDDAVQEEAVRLLRVAARVRQRYWVLIFLAWPLYFEGMARWTQLWGASERDAYTRHSSCSSSGRPGSW